MFDPVSMYATEVLAGSVVAGPYVRAACKRHLDDLQRDDIYFDVDAMQYAIDFFEQMLVLSDGQFDEMPFKLHKSQKFIVGSIFGWKRRSSGLRRFTRAYIEQGKGNGKSPLAGGLGLFGMLADGEPAAQVYAAASSRDQANIMFQDAVRMVENSPALSNAVRLFGNAKIYSMVSKGRKQKGSIFRPVAKTVGTRMSGIRPHMALCDEIHEHPDRTIVDMLERGFKSRRQPLLFMITNSGTDRDSICYEEHQHAIRVATGEVQDDFTFSYVCALDPDDDPFTDPSCWIKANPLLGVILTHDYLEGVVSQARAIPGRQNNILRLHFCKWTDADKAWISREAWESIEDPSMTIDDFAGQECVEGLDLSRVKDITARAVVFPDGVMTDPDTGKQKPCFAAFVYGYTPADTLAQRALEDKADYELWVQQGYLTATPGPVVDYSWVIQDILKDQLTYDLVAVGYDSYMIPFFVRDCDDMGAELPLVEHPQGWSKRKQDVKASDDDESRIEVENELWMPQSIDLTENLILEGRLRVHVNPALRSAVAGATFVESAAGLRRLDKRKATQRIDMAVALVMAIGVAHAHIEPIETGSIHDEPREYPELREFVRE